MSSSIFKTHFNFVTSIGNGKVPTRDVKEVNEPYLALKTSVAEW